MNSPGMCRKREWKMPLRGPVFAQFSAEALNFYSNGQEGALSERLSFGDIARWTIDTENNSYLLCRSHMKEEAVPKSGMKEKEQRK